MDTAYLDNKAGQAFCVWEAPNRSSVESMFSKAGVKPETIREVVAFSG